VLRLRRLFALALLSLWLPATLHCDLEAAGLDTLFHCLTEHHVSTDGAHAESTRDACDIVETGAFQPAADTATLPPPALHALLLDLVFVPTVLPLTPPAHGLCEQVSAPPEVARTWHFVVRAAPPARAPSAAI
jgi:hypothetical protein